MKNCRYCKWRNPQLPSHCFKLGRILDKKEYWNDEPCEFYKNKFVPIEFSSYEEYVKYLKEKGLAIAVTEENNPL